MPYSTMDGFESLETRHLVTSKKQARRMMIVVDEMKLLDWVMQGHEVSATRCVKGIPQGAMLAFSVYRQGLLSIIFEHDSFDVVRVGSPIPIFELEFEDI